MPAKGQTLTPKQERFAQLYVEHGNASQAYREAGYKTEGWKDESIWECACKLLRSDKVSSRVTELQDQHAKRHAITLDSLTEQYREVLKTAQEKGDASTMKGVLDSLAKLHGVWVDKSETRDVSDQHIKAIEDLAAKRRAQIKVAGGTDS